MTLFSELYSAYYRAVAAILRKAQEKPLSEKDIARLAHDTAFGDSAMNIPPALREERWQLLRADGTTPLEHAPSLPQTTLEKRWLRAVMQSPRIRLFCDELEGIDNIRPLYKAEDIFVFDRYADGDDFEDEGYIARFRLILDAVRQRYPLRITAENRKGELYDILMQPDRLEYSEKDDKFRLIGAGGRFGTTVNLARIHFCERTEETPPEANEGGLPRPHARTVCLEVEDRRKALERVMLHFAHFRKQAEQLGGGRYRLTIYYDRADETEMVIRVLSFGPMVRVAAPAHFVSLIRERLEKQRELNL